MTRTFRFGATLAMALSTTPALAADAGSRPSAAGSAQRCDVVGYDAIRMEARDAACLQATGAGSPAGATGGYDPIAMAAIDGARPRPRVVVAAAPRPADAPDEFTQRVWSSP